MINFPQKEFRDFSKKMATFVGFVKNFELACSKKDESLKKILELRNNVLELRKDILLFLQFKDSLLDVLDKEKVWRGKDVGGGRVASRKVFEFKIKKTPDCPLLKNAHYKKMLFHLNEICQELLEVNDSLNVIVSKKIEQKELFERLVEFDSLKWHLIDNHFDDLVSFNQKECFLGKGLLTSISGLLEKYSKEAKIARSGRETG